MAHAEPTRDVRLRHAIEHSSLSAVANRFGVLPNSMADARQGWPRSCGGLRSRRTWIAPVLRCSRPFPSSRFCGIRSSCGMLAFSSARAVRPETSTRFPRQLSRSSKCCSGRCREGPALVQRRATSVWLDGGYVKLALVQKRPFRRAAIALFLSPRARRGHARAAVRAAVIGISNCWSRISPSFVQAHYWTEMHPELASKPDMAENMRGYGGLAALLSTPPRPSSSREVHPARNPPSSQAHRSGAADESRHAFLLRLRWPAAAGQSEDGRSARPAGCSASGCLATRRPLRRGRRSAGAPPDRTELRASSAISKVTTMRSPTSTGSARHPAGRPIVVADVQGSAADPDADR